MSAREIRFPKQKYNQPVQKAIEKIQKENNNALQQTILEAKQQKVQKNIVRNVPSLKMGEMAPLKFTFPKILTESISSLRISVIPILKISSKKNEVINTHVRQTEVIQPQIKQFHFTPQTESLKSNEINKIISKVIQLSPPQTPNYTTSQAPFLSPSFKPPIFIPKIPYNWMPQGFHSSNGIRKTKGKGRSYYPSATLFQQFFKVSKNEIYRQRGGFVEQTGLLLRGY